jgi:uncharacterized membrane protein YccF (DUF307 family)
MDKPTVIVTEEKGPPLLLRIVWFLFVGWWLGQIAILVAWFCNATILLLPLGITLLNKLPQVFTLRMMKRRSTVEASSDLVVVRSVAPQQRPFWQRALYFVLIGWWFSLLWLELAWVLGVIIIGLPLAFWMLGRAAIVTTLERMG